jgi:hypothetical protein
MWEYRLIWAVAPPPWPVRQPEWWDPVWSAGEALLDRQGREPEERPDRYLVIDGRPDIGLKLRGGADGALELKVRHQRQHGWELWEKITFFEWNALEARRFAALVKVDPPVDAVASDSTPAAGAKRFLASGPFDSFVTELHKRRMQASAGELVPDLGEAIDPICFEAMSPSERAPVEWRDAVCAGYPEFLMP